jgi:hypothetical protein
MKINTENYLKKYAKNLSDLYVFKITQIGKLTIN